LATYLVTGGAGFIGSHLVEAILERGDCVRILDNFSTGKRETVELFGGPVEVIEGDIRSFQIVREAVQDVDCVFHQGALPSVPRSLKDPITTNEVNVGGTLNVLEAARDAGVSRVVFASSSSVYGPGRELPKREEMLPQPISPYAVSKLAGERYCHVFTKTFGVETVALRYFNVFGPRQDPQSAYAAFIPKFVQGILNGSPLVIDGDGSQSRDFTYIRNVVQANILAAHVEGIAGQVFNIACGVNLSVNDVVDHIRNATKLNGNVSYGEVRAGDVSHSLADIDLAKELMGYRPEITAQEGLNEVVSWFRLKAEH
tara:strand:- start:92 stop:1033 length:942 start_codon:yes stop_codon:yes gene_type:complete